jgi:hypothetical protein
MDKLERAMKITNYCGRFNDAAGFAVRALTKNQNMLECSINPA